MAEVVQGSQIQAAQIAAVRRALWAAQQQVAALRRGRVRAPTAEDFRQDRAFLVTLRRGQATMMAAVAAQEIAHPEAKEWLHLARALLDANADRIRLLERHLGVAEG